MKKQVLWVLTFVCISSHVKSQGHVLRPGVSISYLPGWFPNNIDETEKGNLWMAGLELNQEIWKESYLSIGILKGKLTIEKEEKHSALFIPVRIQKFFNKERKGWNFAFAAMSGFCSDCHTSFNMSFSEEISYLFKVNPMQCNAGIQLMEGALFNENSIYVGLKVQLWLGLEKDK